MAKPATHLAAPFAVLSDIHGNLRALDAVLAELRRRGVNRVLVAGDHLVGGNDPLATWKRLQEVRAELARGLGDTALALLDPERLVPASPEESAKKERFLATRREVGELILQKLSRLPEQLRYPLADGRELLLCHGSPRDAGTDLSHDCDDDELTMLLAGDPADIIACGGSHVPFDRDHDDVRILGLGSVGEAPEGPIAHFVIVTPRPEGTLLERGTIEYSAT